MPAHLSPVIAATAQWLTRSFPAPGGPLSAALCEIQARQAVTVAARLRYPTPMDAELVGLAGPGGAARLDGITGAEGLGPEPWRSWVDEVVASWAACLLSDAGLAARAVAALPPGPGEYRRLLSPDRTDTRAAVLLRHPDLLSTVAGLHERSLLARLGHGSTLAA
ncbi:hypothetical protein OIE82_32105 [Streptomyces althioticus]|uniref:Uncharacterized protein n=1 Tax=Streptomyces althioticus TaxID=83380 RepID=A0ABZ1YD94_9ACTN|nr:hypothetical protein OG968_32475 [Streptomyces althioticus]WTB97338.1 hypothetical protein OHA53_03375 [Streptomyces althioticus]WTC26835.1 hypothetical protein OG872_30910 [Streptomyces althioticus]